MGADVTRILNYKVTAQADASVARAVSAVSSEVRKLEGVTVGQARAARVANQAMIASARASRELGAASVQEARARAVNADATAKEARALKAISDQRFGVAKRQKALNAEEDADRRRRLVEIDREARSTAAAEKRRTDALQRSAREAEKAYDGMAAASERANRRIVADFRREQQERERAESRARQNAQRLIGGAQVAGGALTAGVSAPIVGAAVYGIRQAISREAAFAEVKEFVHAPEAQMEQLRQQVRALSLDKKVGLDFGQVAHLMAGTAQLGISPQNLAMVTRQAAYLRSILGGDGDAAVQGVTKLRSALVLDEQEIPKITSAFASMREIGSSKVQEVVQTTLRLASAAREVGLKVPAIMGFSNALVSMGQEPEAAGTALSRTIRSIERAVDDGSPKLRVFAGVARMSAEDFSRAWRTDPQAALLAFFSGLNQLHGKLGEQTKALDALGVKNVREVQAIQNLAAGHKLAANAIRKATEAYEGHNRAEEAAAEKAKTTKEQLALLKREVDDAAATLGEALLPTLRTFVQQDAPHVVDAIKDVANWFHNLSGDAQSAWTKVALVSAFAGPVISAGAQIAGAVLKIRDAYDALKASEVAAGETAGATARDLGALSKLGKIIIPIVVTVAVVEAAAGAFDMLDKAWGGALGKLIAEKTHGEATSITQFLNQGLGYKYAVQADQAAGLQGVEAGPKLLRGQVARGIQRLRGRYATGPFGPGQRSIYDMSPGEFNNWWIEHFSDTGTSAPPPERDLLETFRAAGMLAPGTNLPDLGGGTVKSYLDQWYRNETFTGRPAPRMYSRVPPGWHPPMAPPASAPHSRGDVGHPHGHPRPHPHPHPDPYAGRGAGAGAGGGAGGGDLSDLHAAEAETDPAAAKARRAAIAAAKRAAIAARRNAVDAAGAPVAADQETVKLLTASIRGAIANFTSIAVPMDRMADVRQGIGMLADRRQNAEVSLAMADYDKDKARDPRHVRAAEAKMNARILAATEHRAEISELLDQAQAKHYAAVTAHQKRVATAEAKEEAAKEKAEREAEQAGREKQEADRAAAEERAKNFDLLRQHVESETRALEYLREGTEDIRERMRLTGLIFERATERARAYTSQFFDSAVHGVWDVSLLDKGTDVYGAAAADYDRTMRGLRADARRDPTYRMESYALDHLTDSAGVGGAGRGSSLAHLPDHIQKSLESSGHMLGEAGNEFGRRAADTLIEEMFSRRRGNRRDAWKGLVEEAGQGLASRAGNGIVSEAERGLRAGGTGLLERLGWIPRHGAQTTTPAVTVSPGSGLGTQATGAAAQALSGLHPANTGRAVGAQAGSTLAKYAPQVGFALGAAALMAMSAGSAKGRKHGLLGMVGGAIVGGLIGSLAGPAGTFKGIELGSNFGAALGGAFAGGGRALAGRVNLFGEKGPELGVLPEDMHIFTAEQTRSILGGRGGGSESGSGGSGAGRTRGSGDGRRVTVVHVNGDYNEASDYRDVERRADQRDESQQFTR